MVILVIKLIMMMALMIKRVMTMIMNEDSK